MTSNDEVSFGTWKVADARPMTFVAKHTVLEARLTSTDLRLIDQTGQTLGTWGVDRVTMYAYRNTDAYLQLDRDVIWIRSPEKRPSQDLRDAIYERKTPIPVIDPREQLLAAESLDWTAPAVLREYKDDKLNREAFAQEVKVFGRHGYTPVTQSADGGHVHVGRLLLTGGLSVFAGKQGIRSDGIITVTFQRAADVRADHADGARAGGPSGQAGGLDTLALLEKLGQLRDAGVVTDEEFEAKKADLLARL